jgi:hypothetical protein
VGVIAPFPKFQGLENRIYIPINQILIRFYWQSLKLCSQQFSSHPVVYRLIYGISLKPAY